MQIGRSHVVPHRPPAASSIPASYERFFRLTAGLQRGEQQRMLPLILTLAVTTQNFSANDAELVSAAENARWRSALFWSGQPLAGNWSRPCPIAVQSRNTSAGGATRFVFDRGEVFGWSMTLTGRRDDIFANALPHEVDHMVRATLVRRPIVRWLDEGCSALFESAKEHERLRTRAAQFARSGRSPAFLTATDYPTNSRDIADLYAVGFSLVEHLLRRDGQQSLLTLQASTRALTQALQDTYRLTPETLIDEWRNDVLARPGLDCTSHGCRFHGQHVRKVLEHTVSCTTPNCTAANTMVVWIAAWCGACRAFWGDYQSDPAFRAAINQRVHLHIVNADDHPFQARRHHIRSLPTFVLNSSRLEGYRGKDDFLIRLASLTAGSTSPTTNPQSEQPQPLASPPAIPNLEPTNKTATDGIQAISEPVLQPDPASVDVEARPPMTCPTPTHGRLYTIAGLTLTALEWFGLAGATTGPAGLALAALSLWRRRRRKLPTPSYSAQRPPEVPPSSTPQHNSADYEHAPFPRELDEARELLRLRQREGRVAALDAIRGMVVDDELDRLAAAGQSDTAESLRQRLNDRVQAIAPIASK